MSETIPPAPERVILFAKAPILGTVKTRLAAAIGEGEALAVYVEILSALMRNLIELETLTLCITPDDAEGAFDRPGCRGREMRPQGAGDLGARLASAFSRAFDEGAKRVVIVGADCPYVRANHIREAWLKLAGADLVLGPALDGGYWLIGLSRPVLELFRGIPWSSADVFDRTVAVARGQRLAVALLETLGDIDTEEDWLAYKKMSVIE